MAACPRSSTSTLFPNEKQQRSSPLKGKAKVFQMQTNSFMEELSLERVAHRAKRKAVQLNDEKCVQVHLHLVHYQVLYPTLIH